MFTYNMLRTLVAIIIIFKIFIKDVVTKVILKTLKYISKPQLTRKKPTTKG